MNIKEVNQRLRELGVEIPKDTIKRWAYSEHIISRPTKPRLGGSGHFSKWPPRVIKEAAAVWAVRNRAKKIAAEGGRKKKTLSAKEICEIRRHAKGVFVSPCMEYELPPNITITTPNPSYIYDFRALTPKIVADAALNDLVIAWIAATVKAQKKRKISEPAEVIFSWRYDPPPPVAREELYSLTDDQLYTRLKDARIKAMSSSLKRKRMEISDAGDFAFKINENDELEVKQEFKLDYVDVKPYTDIKLRQSRRDDLVILLDGKDGRKKASYAPFEVYNPYAEYSVEYRA
jgi:hypothetical protein